MLPKQVDREFKDTRDSWFWRQTLTTRVMWLCLSNQKGELTWSHSFLIVSFDVRALEWSEFMHVHSAKRLQPKELSSIDFIAKENFSILIGREHHYSTWPIFGLPNDQELPFFGLTNKATWPVLLTSGAKISCNAYLWIHGLPVAVVI